MFLVSGGVVPDRWDAEAEEMLCCCVTTQPGHVGYCPASGARVAQVSTIIHRAYWEGLKRARDIALTAAGEYPEDIFRPIESGELMAIGSLSDRIGAHMARVTARNIAHAIRREIEGV